MLALFALVVGVAPAHPELGRVSWLRDLEVARAQSRVTGKPVLVLFDEVPGCATVRGFGRDVLSDEAIVSRVERDFIPVAIFNNVGGADRRVLERFGEPAWNNPVVHVIDAEQRPLAPRFDGPDTKEAFVKLLDGVKAGNEPAPMTVLLAAHCFWECEARLGRLPAAMSSQVGFLEGREVVELTFDSRLSSFVETVRAAEGLDCALKVFTRTETARVEAARVVGARASLTTAPFSLSEKDTKFYLRQAGRELAPLTPLEQVRMNAALRFSEDPEAARASCRQR